MMEKTTGANEILNISVELCCGFKHTFTEAEFASLLDYAGDRGMSVVALVTAIADGVRAECSEEYEKNT